MVFDTGKQFALIMNHSTVRHTLYSKTCVIAFIDMPHKQSTPIRTEPCQALLRTGVCERGADCKFSHSFEVLKAFSEQQQILLQRPSEDSTFATSNFVDEKNKLPPELQVMIDSLPPSLMPPPIGGYTFNGAATWG